jgi:predicted nucleic-acid-binding Zn-ribbon protein
MGLVLELRCRDCGFHTGYAEGVLLATCDDGVDKVCPHPLEGLYAKEHTGLEIGELSAQGRLHAGLPVFCARCGTTDFHRTPAPAGGYACEACRGERFHAMAELAGTSKIASVLGWAAFFVLVASGGMLAVFESGRVALFCVELFVPLVLAARLCGYRARRRARERIPCPKCGETGLFTRSIGIS